MVRHLISISEMAKLHGLTRQTLIHYDTIGLFKPAEVDEKGYRYYSKRQIPYLREICFLKSLGIGLKEIVEHFDIPRRPQHEMAMLDRHKQQVIQQIAHLNKIREAINQKMSLYGEAVEANAMDMRDPFLKYFPQRKVVFKEFEQPINRENLHMTLMSLWRQLFSQELLPSYGFGSIIRQSALKSDSLLTGAGSCIFIPTTYEEKNTLTIPAGEYACLYKYGMPYDTLYAEELLDWVEANGYKTCGDIVDVCLLDTTFYQQDVSVDFCMLQIPVTK